MNTLQNIFQNSSFKIFQCRNDYVGTDVNGEYAKLNLPKKLYQWDSSPEHPFRDLHFCRIYWITKGCGTLLTKKGPLEMKEGNLYFLPSNSIIGSKCNCLMHHYFMHFTNEVLNNYFDFIDYDTCIPASEPLISAFQALDKICRQYQSLTKYSNALPFTVSEMLETDAYLKIILSKFFQKTKDLPSNISKFHAVLDYINNHLNEPLSLNTLSEIMSYSPVYFSNSFTKTFHKTPTKYIAEKKLLYAKQLLLNSNLSIKEIAIQCGFFDQFYFSNWFYKNTKQYPSNFRKE